MKNTVLYSIVILLTSLALTACSSDDEGNDKHHVTSLTQMPSWQVNWTSDDERPDWQEPSPSDYENWAVMLLQLEDELKPYVDKDDMMALFVNNELRGLAKPAVTLGGEEDKDKGSFLMKAYGNEEDQKLLTLTLCYYSCNLKQVFSRTVQMQYKVGEVFGIDEDIIPQFTLGSSKYPVVVNVPLTNFNEQLSTVITPAVGDMIGVFMGEECRGACTLDDKLLGKNMIVYARNSNETATLRYYQAATQKVYSFTKPIKIEN